MFRFLCHFHEGLSFPRGSSFPRKREPLERSKRPFKFNNVTCFHKHNGFMGITIFKRMTEQMSFTKTLMNKKGMTLLEVLIALTLFTVISISLVRMTSKTTQYRKKITLNMQDTKYSRNILQIIRKDIRNIFYTTDMNALTHVLFRKQSQKPSDSNTEAQTKLKKFEETVEPYLFQTIPVSGGIIGKTNSLHIASLSNIHIQENAKSSDQNAITYYLKPCKNRENKKEKISSCLWRKFSSVITQDLENLKDYDEFVLLEKVKVFQLSYYSKSSNEWLNEWKTGPNERNFLPSAIHIEIEFENKKKQSIKQNINVPLHQQFILPVEKSI